MYWRIPGYLRAIDLQGVVSVLSEQLASGAPPLAEAEKELQELQRDDTDEEEHTEQVAPASPTLDPEPDNNVDDVEGTICIKVFVIRNVCKFRRWMPFTNFLSVIQLTKRPDQVFQLLCYPTLKLTH